MSTFELVDQRLSLYKKANKLSTKWVVKARQAKTRKVVTVTLAKVGLIPKAEVRVLAREAIAALSKGENPNEKRKEEQQEQIEKAKAEREALLNTFKERGIKRWDYKHIRLDYKGRGITQEINLLDIDGERVRGWSDNFSSKEVPTLPEILNKLGDDGWEMISHVVNQDLAQNGTTMHYYNFKREKL